MNNNIERLTTNQIILRSKNGSVKIGVDNNGNLIFSSANNSNTGSFSFDLKNDKISVKKVEFKKDSSSLTSSLNIGSSGTGTSIADSKFDPSTGKLIDGFLSDDVADALNKGVTAHGKFDGITGKLIDTHISDTVIGNINKGITAHGKFDNITGKLFDDHISDPVKGDIAKGVTAHGKFDGITGKLIDDNLSTIIQGNITKGVTAHGKFDGISGKLIDQNISDGILDNINKGVSVHDDFGNLDFSLDNSNPSIPIIKLSRGSRGTSSTTLTKSSIGLANTENKTSQQIRNEITIVSGILTGIGTSNIKVDNESAFSDSRFTTVQGNASNGSTAFGYFSSGLLKEANTPEGLKNSNLNLSQASDGTISLARGGGLSSLTANPLSTATFLNTYNSASEARSYFNSSGKLNKSNLTADTARTNLTRLAGGVSVNFFSETSQPTPTVVIDDTIQVKSITTKNDGTATENLFNGRTYIKDLFPIGTNSYLGGAAGDAFYYSYIKNGQFTNTLTVDNIFGASTSGITLFKNIITSIKIDALSLQSGHEGELHLKQITNTAGSNSGVCLENSANTNTWNMFHDVNRNLAFDYNHSLKGYINDSATGGSLNFTGQHRNIPENNQDNFSDKTGLIVVSCGTYASVNSNSITINEALPKIKLSNKRNQKNVFGVVSNHEDENETKREYNFGHFVSVHEKQIDDNRLIINSLGEGGIWVCNINGNLENGDYITTCEIPGYGMKQDDDLLHNYTVAKITCDCDFNLESPIYICEEFEFEGKTYRKAFVGCTYHCG